MSEIKSVAVIGAGVMGAAIAAHVANAGIKVKLLDIVKPDAPDRDAVAIAAIAGFKKIRPSPLMGPKAARLITPGNVEDDLQSLGECDWIVEAVVERLDIKQALYRKLASVRKPGSVISSNTSTIPLRELAAAMPDDLRPDFVITHFFNPPRYMRLLELVTGPETNARTKAMITRFCDVMLGKTVLACNDTPGFIANRIGTYWIQTAMVLALGMGLEVEEADAIMGRPMGFPATGIFGLMDLVGIDLGPHVNASLARLLPAADAFHAMNPETTLITDMIAQGYTGKKGKGGFYRDSGRGAEKVKEALSLQSAASGALVWRPAIKPDIAEVKAAKKDLKKLIGADSKYGEYAWGVLGRVLAYAASLLGEIAGDIASIDEAMRLGYTWKFGPFELIDQLGVEWVAKNLARIDVPVPPILARIGGGAFYQEADGALLQFGADGKYHPVTRPDGVLLLEDVKRQTKKPVLANKSASVWDIGDGVLCFEFHSIMNAIDPDTLSLLEKTIALVSKSFKALVIYSENLRAGPGRENFSVGANLGLAMFAVNIRLWGKVENTLKDGQRIFQALRHAPFPTIGAPAGRALGGGCEILLNCSAVQAYAETYLGLVECGVGLVPGWGGTAAMLARYQHARDMPQGPMPAVAKVFEMISTAQVSTSAAEAREMKFIRETDGITMNRTRVLADAKVRALALVEHYQPPAPQIMALPGETGRIALGMAVAEFHRKGVATAHDVTVSRHLAEVLTGGDTDIIEPLTETQIMDLERRAFMALIRTKESQARIKHTLDSGRPLRN